VPDTLSKREIWFKDALSKLRDANLIFFDPDNGLDVPSKTKGAKKSSKYLYRDEIAATYTAGHSILLYQHFTREKREGFLARLGKDLKEQAPSADLWVVRSPHVVFFMLIHANHRDALQRAAQSVKNFDAKFLTADPQ
jgi:hypothetical protein